MLLCSPQGAATIDEAKQIAAWANVGFTVGGLALVSGVILYLTAPKATRSRKSQETSELLVTPWLSTNSGGAMVKGWY